MSSAEGTTDRRALETLLEGLGAALTTCARALAGPCPHVSSAWAAAGQALCDGFSLAPSGHSHAAGFLLAVAGDPLTPPFLIVDGLIALIAEQVATDAQPEHVVAVDRSLDGLRRLAGLLHRTAPLGAAP